MGSNERFIAFLNGIPGSEQIDEMALTSRQREGQKADYLFNDRKVVCEVKRILEDPFYKIKNEVQRLQEREDWPLVMDERSLSSIIRKLPDGNGIQEALDRTHTDILEESIKDANRQIRSTKATFNLPDSSGLLIILNESVHSLSPGVIARRISKCLMKARSTGRPRFERISAVLVIHTAHVIQESENLFAFPIYAIPNPNIINESIRSFVDTLMSSWCEFEGIHGVDTDWGSMDFRFHDATEIP